MTEDGEIEYMMDMIDNMEKYEFALEDAIVTQNFLTKNRGVLNAVWSARHNGAMSPRQLVVLSQCRRDMRQILSEVTDIDAEYEYFRDTGDYVFDDVLPETEKFSPGKLKRIQKKITDEIDRLKNYSKRSDALDVKMQDLLLSMNIDGGQSYPKLI